MFSGIVQCVGEIKEICQVTGGGKEMTVFAPLPVERFEQGASVAHSGACMTVVTAWAVEGGTEFAIGISPESLAKTTMNDWVVGTPVNIETSLAAGDPNGGHDVRGHVDGLAE
ncbi:MAG: riboflavin synthase, partial [Sphaerospermopsis sp. SIO1G2]|nr:riboflavin synthase [Sphaerospermopsis sp. SIO1G2]